MRIISILVSVLFIVLNIRKLLNVKKKNIYIFDVDNTVCDTWKSLPRHKSKSIRFMINERSRIKKLIIFPKMRKFIEEIRKKEENIVFLLSARNIYLWDSTYYYFKKKDLKFKFHSILLVSKVIDKIFLIKLILFLKSKKKIIHFYDDLSYHHEYGAVLFYGDIINSIRKLDIKYYDYDNIKKFQNIE